MSPRTSGTGYSSSSLSREQAEAYLLDLHYEMIRLLPDKGQKMGFRPLARPVRDLTEQLNKRLPNGAPTLSTTDVSSEMRSLHKLGLVAPVYHPSGRTLGWQRESRAAELLNKREA